MYKLVKNLAVLTLIILTTSSIILGAPVTALSNPSTPEFSLEYIDKSYYVPPTYTVNPYTGKNESNGYGEIVDYQTVEIMIRNQPFTSYLDSDSNNIRLFYCLRHKGHYSNVTDWAYHPNSQSHHYYFASSSDYTNITLVNYQFGNAGEGTTVDFQVQALIGYEEEIIRHTYMGDDHSFNFIGEKSEWSSTQTVMVPYSHSTETQEPPSTTDELPSLELLKILDWEKIAIIFLTIIVAILTFAVVVLFRKIRKIAP